MNLIIRQARIYDRQSVFHDKVCDVLVSDGLIKKISEKITDRSEREIDGKNCCLAPGFFDLHVNFREPGHEYKENIQSGCKASIAGGFTGVLQMPSTLPVIQSKAGIDYMKKTSVNLPVDIEIAGALSVNLEGHDLAEMYDMKANGALCFTDDKNSVQDAGLMMRALLYSKNFNGLVMSFPDDKSISGTGQINEGAASTSLGLKGIPAIAEELMVSRDLLLSGYTNSRIHFSTISAAGSVALIRDAKARGIQVTCDVAAHNLALNDTSLEEFDTNFKVKPPLRSDADILALRSGLKDGTIDAICSDHTPEDVENKLKEFDHASFGAEGLETAFASAYTSLKDTLTNEQLFEKFSNAPRKLLSLPVIRISEGEMANLVLVDLHSEWTVRESDIVSKSKNNPFIGKKLTGKIKAVMNKGKVTIF